MESSRGKSVAFRDTSGSARRREIRPRTHAGYRTALVRIALRPRVGAARGGRRPAGHRSGCHPAGDGRGFWKSGGPAVRAAAERALTGSDASVVQFLGTERAAAEYQDDKEAALQIVAQGTVAPLLAGVLSITRRAYSTPSWASPVSCAGSSRSRRAF
ncbi:ALF repeat-containing protein [Streptomyces sp. CB00455]|uniref:ALF repeat-containing protein n=1 Tax=Streptomyces sp. CB00455 TaxID=1703927 RepID=UPI00093E71F7